MREGRSYRLSYEVAPGLQSHRGSTVFVEDTISVSDLAFERRLLRLFDENGQVTGETDQRILSRAEADAAQYEWLMREADTPPASWQVRRRTPAEVLAWATSVYGNRAPPSATASPAQPAAPSTSREP